MTKPLLVSNNDAEYLTVSYYDNNDSVKRAFLDSQWKKFSRHDPAMGQTYEIWCRMTNPQMEVVVDRLMPSGSLSGLYRIETFIPAIHAESKRTIFTITLNVNSVDGNEQEETSIAVLDLSDKNDIWYPLGEFQLDPSSHPLVGKVRQYDLSLEDPQVEISFAPIRWIPLFPLPGKRNRYDSPVGTVNERNGVFPTGRVAFGKCPIWAGQWFDINPFLNWYIYGYHTGADLNLPGSSGADQGKEIYCVGDGIVSYAGRAGSWGNIIVIEHPEAKVTLPNGETKHQTVYSRYGHVDDRILVKAGQIVKRGLHIGHIGLPANQISGWHLHFDVCYSDLLKRRPAHWPNMDTIRSLRLASDERRNSRGYNSAKAAIMREVVNNYVDPLQFIRENHA